MYETSAFPMALPGMASRGMDEALLFDLRDLLEKASAQAMACKAKGPTSQNRYSSPNPQFVDFVLSLGRRGEASIRKIWPSSPD